MKILENIAKLANRLLMILVIVCSLVLFVYSLYVLYDVFYTGKNAFISYDLLQYRPKVSSAEEDSRTSFEELLRLNPDTVGWVEIYGTNICYPIVQGRDDLEYAGKDIYGYSSLTGSIYLASENGSSFGDRYNLIYGHHMDNGAMFGDIEKYRDQNFYNAHRKGLLQTLDGNYELTITACVLTNSYEDIIYSVAPKDSDDYEKLQQYIQENAVLYNEEEKTETPDDTTKLLAFSTCEAASTNGRLVLFADAKKIEGPVSLPETEPVQPNKLMQAIGHVSGESSWAFLNLVCVLLTLLIFLPVLFLKRKYRQFGYARRTVDQISRALEQKDGTLSPDERSAISETAEGLKKLTRKMRIGIAAELLLTVCAVAVFLLTENITKPMVIRDRWTGYMLLIAYLALFADFLFFRYRGRRLSQAENEKLLSVTKQ